MYYCESPRGYDLWKLSGKLLHVYGQFLGYVNAYHVVD